MLNKVILMGRITHDLEVRQTPNGTPVLSFSIAVERNFARQGEERQTDFINCVAWNRTAEFIGRYFGKGRMIAIVGNIRTRNYEDKNGIKRYVTEVFVDEASFTGEPKQQGGYAQNSYGGYGDGNNGGYQQNGGYGSNGGYGGGQSQGGGYNNRAAQQQAPAPAQQDETVNIGEFQDFDLFNDDGVPF